MTDYSFWRPGDEIVVWMLNVLLQITLVTGLSLLGGCLLRRNAAARYGVLGAGLVVLLFIPLTTGLMQSLGWGLMRAPLITDTQISRGVAERALDTEVAEIGASLAAPDDEILRRPPPVLRPFGRPSSAASITTNQSLSESLTHRDSTVDLQRLGESPGRNARDQTKSAVTSVFAVSRIVAPWGLLIWATGLVVLAVRLFRGWLRLAKVLRQVRPLDTVLDSHVARFVVAEARRIAGLTFDPTVFISSEIHSPFAAGWLRPRVVLPEAILDQINHRQLRDILIHEMAHLRRRDQFAVLLQSVVRAVFWIHPLVHVVVRRLAVAQEEICDNYVLASGDAPSYSRTLLRVAELIQAIDPLPAWPASVGLWTSHWKLESRVAGILEEQRDLTTHMTKRATALLLMLALLMGTLGPAANIRLANADNIHTQPAAARPTKAPPASAAANASAVTTFQGRVLDPNGKPVDRAVIYAAKFHWTDGHYMGAKFTELARTRSDREGRFRLSCAKPRVDIAHRGPDRWEDMRLVATAPGFGPACVIVNPLESFENVVFRLAVDDLPINGRIVDLEGGPIAGVHVAVKRLYVGGEAAPMLPDNAFGLPKPTTTDAQGRFRFTGLGRERFVMLEARGPTVAQSWIAVETKNRNSSPFPVSPMFRSEVRYGATFDFPAEPTQPVVGVVRDADTKRPIPGVQIQTRQYADELITMESFVTTRSDKHGRFRLVGLPQGGGHRLAIVPNDEQPYFALPTTIPRAAGLDAIEVNVELKPAIWIKGRVVDEKSGQGEPAFVQYFPFLSNSNAKDYPNFNPNRASIGFSATYRTDAEGTFRIPGLRGRGVVVARSFRGAYFKKGRGAQAIEGLLGERGQMLTYGRMSSSAMNTVQEMRLSADAMEGRCTLRLEPQSRHRVVLVDEDGKPLRGVSIKGRLPRFTPYRDQYEAPLESDHFEVVGLDENVGRVMLFKHKKRNLAKIVTLNTPEDSRTAITIRLKKCGTIAGRLVDQQGHHLAGARVSMNFADHAHRKTYGLDRDGKLHTSRATMNWATTDDNGEFRFEGVLPEKKYALWSGATELGAFLVKPGATIRLGDRVATAKANPAKPK